MAKRKHTGDRTKFLQIRVSPADHERVRQAADEAGLSISDWCRKVLMEASGGPSFLAERASELIQTVRLADLIQETGSYERWTDIRDNLETPNTEELTALIGLFPEKKQWLLTGKH